MELKKKNEKEILHLVECEIETGERIPLLRYPLLEETGMVEHCFTTRMGGVSEGIFASMNLSFTRGDKPEAVEENFRRIAETFHKTCGDFVFTDQTHTTNVRRVTRDDMGKGILCERDYADVDGLITNETGIILATFFADCVPLYFVDTKNKAIGMSHSGWRGTVNRMGKATIDAMKEAYGTKAEDLVCAIGPSICMDCYEVSEDVAEAFKRAFPNQTDEILLDKGNGKYQLDLWRANELILLEEGVKKERIATTNICTSCNEKYLFSHRASHGKRGNLGAFLMLKA